MSRDLFATTAKQRPNPYVISEVPRDLRSELLERRERYFAEEAVPLAKVVKQGQRAGVFRPGSALATARVLVIATNSLLPFSLSARELAM